MKNAHDDHLIQLFQTPVPPEYGRTWRTLFWYVIDREWCRLLEDAGRGR